MSFLLGFRGRALSAGFATMGLAVMAPAGLSGLSAIELFLSTPLGLGILALSAIAVGVSVEETGTIRRIQIGIAIRLVAPVLLLAAAVWAAALGSPSASLAGFGWTFFALSAASVLYAARRDVAAYTDPRSGQDVRLEDITGAAMRLTIQGAEVLIPTSALLGAVPAASLDGRGAFITVTRRDGITGDARALPWVSQSAGGDTFLLTEHQAGMDATELVAKVLEAAAAGKEGGYR